MLQPPFRNHADDSGAAPERRPSFDTEVDAKEHLTEMIGDRFRLIPEVWMTHRDGKILRIDFIAIPKAEALFPAALFGIEVKKGYPDFRDFTAALKQSADYRDCKISDKRSTQSQGVTPKFVFLYPPFTEVGDDLTTVQGYREGGALRALGKWNIGVIRPRTGGWNHDFYYRFEIAATPIWDSRYGPRGDAARFGTARRIGSTVHRGDI